MPNTNGSIEDLLSKSSTNKLQGNSATTANTDYTAKPVSLDKKLIEIKFIENEKKIQTKASALGVPYIDLTEFPISADALQLIPENISIANNIICFLFTGEQIRLATTDPENPEITKISSSLAEAQHAKIETYMISERNLKNALAQYAKIPKYEKKSA